MKKEQLLKNMQVNIDSVIGGTINEVELHYIVPYDVINYIEENYCKEWDIEINGWDCDFWITFEISGKNYILTGSGFYGGLQFSIQE